MKHSVAHLMLMFNVNNQAVSSEILADVETNLGTNSPPDKRIWFLKLLLKYKSMFQNVTTNVHMSDLSVADPSPVKEHLYHVTLMKLEKLRQTRPKGV